MINMISIHYFGVQANCCDTQWNTIRLYRQANVIVTCARIIHKS